MNTSALRYLCFSKRCICVVATAISLLSFAHINAQSSKPALAEIKIAAESGDPAAQHKLAEAYAGSLDSQQAQVWYRKSAEQGYAPAQARLGKKLLNYSQSFSTPSADRAPAGAEALKWLLLAANQGNTSAQADLAKVYLDGKLVSMDLVEAYKWGDLAAKGSSIDVAQIAGTSSRNAAILKMTPEQINEAQKRVAAFSPHQPKQSEIPPPTWLQQIKLKSISGPPERRFVLINNQTFQKGDASPVKVGDKTVKVRCLEIRDASVTVSIEGIEGTNELRLP